MTVRTHVAATRVGNPAFIGGDIHSYWTTDLEADFSNPSSATVATEFVGTSITSSLPSRQQMMAILHENPHVAVDLTRDRMETRLQVISDRRDPNATLSTLKRFVVESGRPGAIPG
jgi:alkaline phosphatase D